MLTSLAYIFLFGFLFGAIFSQLKLPKIIGMLLAGILIGPHVLNLLDDSILLVSADLRKMALIIILLKAGLSLDLNDLKKVGRPAILLSCVPASCEILGYVLFAPKLLHISLLDAAIMGSVLAAVSPAVVVPRMVNLMETRQGTDKRIPQMIMAGASCDDIFVIVLFSTFTGMATGGQVHVLDFINIPVSIVLGILLGAVVGYVFTSVLEFLYVHNHMVGNSTKVILILGISFLLMAIESWLDGIVSFSGLLAVVSMACVIKKECCDEVTNGLSAKFGKLWIGAEVILFVLVGAAVNIRYTLNAGAMAIVMIFIALLFRSIGVCLCMVKTPLNKKERLFCIIAYLPKATVQAAIGSVPLSMGLSCGNIVLSIAVLGILITAPLGAFGIDFSTPYLLNHEE